MKIQFIILTALLFFYSCSSSSKFSSNEEKQEEKRSSVKFTDEKPAAEEAKENKIPIIDEPGNEANNEIEVINTPAIETTDGVASYYAHKFHGRKTASGEIYDMHALTAAHINYPFGTILRITNFKNQKSVTVRINDRKPNNNGRAIDLSLQAAKEIEMVRSGIAHVKIEVLEWGEKK